MIIALQTLVFFRESLLTALARLLGPYYKQITLAFSRSGHVSEDEESDDQVFSEFDDEKGVTFYPPVYAQRYAAVSDCLMDDRWCGKLEKVVDFGYHDMSFIKYLKEVPGVRCILGVDIEAIPLRCSSDLLGNDEYAPKRENPLQVTLLQGNAADPDYRLIGCDAVISIEMIEHMLPHDLERLVHNIFGFIKPWVVVITTPNADFNGLFKALEKNGLRRMDHLFEWTREQFHDWCTNIGVRYPNYTVTCQGIGPGPPGTLHYGCCSQLALFVSKDYHKQADLHLNSLALVANAPNPNNFSRVFGTWESSETVARDEGDSRCTLQPPDRLNCTTLQANKFSKTTQNLMAKNKIDSLVHTREVVNEIRHLTKALNFNTLSQQENGTNIWSNINWGDNAPYWNQYYKIVREYIYPFETKSEEVRILDLVSEEINRLIDSQYDDEISVDVNRLEIPMTNLMNVVQHITDDVDRIRDLLEWNGYEIVDDVVIHSRLVVDATSIVTHDEDWQEIDTLSDWDNTDVNSTSMSDGSTIVPDYHERCLRRALDNKVRNLRTMLSADEDITTELDRVVCRLMKLALRSSKRRQSPPPSKWLQCKMLDLLTLTENAIGRRKKHFANAPVKAIEYYTKPQELELEQDDRVKEIVDKYRHILQPMAEKTMSTDKTNDALIDLDVEDDFLSTDSIEFLKDFEYIERVSPSLVIPQPVFSTEVFEPEEITSKENLLERTKAWLDEDVEVVPCPKHEMNFENISSGDTDHSVSNARHKHKKSSKKHKRNTNKDLQDLETAPCKTSQSKTSYKIKIKREDKNKKSSSSTKLSKKLDKKKSNNNCLVKNSGGILSSPEYENNFVRSKWENKEHQSSVVKASKPIPESLIEFSHLDLGAEKDVQEFRVANNSDETNDIVISNQDSSNISATETSFLIDIVTQDFEETIALRRTIGTDAEVASEIMTNDQVETLSNNFDENLCTKHEVSTENMQSQTIFLNDINEPSTSKGIRHNISTDVQCGPDSLVSYPMLSASTSLVKVSQVFATGIQINDVVADAKLKGTDFGTSTQDNNNYNTIITITPRQRSVGIKIKDSDGNICTNTECSTMTIVDSVTQPFQIVSNSQCTRKSDVTSGTSSPETKLLKPISSVLKMEDSSEFCTANRKTVSYVVNVFKKASNALIGASASNEELATGNKTTTKYTRPKLCCGGVHVHSFRDKLVSEDIVYQGEWQRYTSKALTRKKACSITTSRKSNEAVNRKKTENLKEKKVYSKEKVFMERQEKKPIEAQSKKPTQTRNLKLYKLRQKDISNDQIHKVRLKDVTNVQIKKPLPPKSAVKVTNTMRIPRPIKIVTKVASIITLSAISTKNAKSAYTVRKPAILPNLTVKKDNEKPPKLKKSYIPLYLKKTAQTNLNKSIDSSNVTEKARPAYKIAPLVRSKTDEIRKVLLKLSDEVRENISYVVFQNDLQNKIELSDEQTSETSDNNKTTGKQFEMLNRTHSPSSLNSSTCSSPNSVATVRAASTRVKNTSNRRHSASSYISSLTTSESDNPTPTKAKKIVKRYKSAKKSESKNNDNKENIPESTKNFASKDKDKMSKSPFVGRHKSVCIAQVKTESTTSNSLSRPKVQISNKSIKIPTPKDDDEKRKSSGTTVSKKRSLKSDTSSIYEELNQSQTESFDSSNTANMVLVLEPQPTYEELSGTQNFSLLSEEPAIKCDNNLSAERVQNSSLNSHASDILNSMRHLLEETVDLILNPCEHNTRHISSKTVILSGDENEKSTGDRVASLGSKTVIISTENINSDFLENDKVNPLNRTFDSVLGDESMFSLNDTRLTVTDLDLLSFKSITSVSKHSEYYIAENEGNTSKSTEPTQNTISVRDLFERKEPHMVQNAPGALAVQAFSGFSLDAEPVAGDQPDSIALIDSETGSLALDITRQATSEELFISGRSSDSYGSCVIEEDAVVPNWLFQIISQQQSVVEEPEPVLLGPVAAQPVEPLYDANGNVIEPSIVGVGAGAGDGRGMHSDYSQDSSGRGTSLSSTDTSSGPQSDVSAILIDPSGFTTQFELLRDPIASSVLVPVEGNPNNATDITYRIDDDTGTLIGALDDQTGILNGASDIDADISSIDTDVPDSSDN